MKSVGLIALDELLLDRRIVGVNHSVSFAKGGMCNVWFCFDDPFD